MNIKINKETIPVKIDGVNYNSIAHAASSLGLSTPTIRRGLKKLEASRRKEVEISVKITKNLSFQKV